MAWGPRVETAPILDTLVATAALGPYAWAGYIHEALYADLAAPESAARGYVGA